MHVAGGDHHLQEVGRADDDGRGRGALGGDGGEGVVAVGQHDAVAGHGAAEGRGQRGAVGHVDRALAGGQRLLGGGRGHGGRHDACRRADRRRPASAEAAGCGAAAAAARGRRAAGAAGAAGTAAAGAGRRPRRTAARCRPCAGLAGGAAWAGRRSSPPRRAAAARETSTSASVRGSRHRAHLLVDEGDFVSGNVLRRARRSPGAAARPAAGRGRRGGPRRGPRRKPAPASAGSGPSTLPPIVSRLDPPPRWARRLLLLRPTSLPST